MRYQIISNIYKLKKQKFDLEEKIKCYTDKTGELVKLINQKKSELQINTNTIEYFRESIKEKVTSVEKYK